jgi:acetylornithine aminotransferase
VVNRVWAAANRLGYGNFFVNANGGGITDDHLAINNAGVLISPKFTPVYGQLGTTFGGNHLACAAAIAVLDVMKAENLVENAAKVGTHLLEELKGFKGIKEVRGRGLMIGMEFEEPIKELRQKLLFEEKVFTGVSGTNVIRLLPPLCLSMNEADEFLTRLHRLIK